MATGVNLNVAHAIRAEDANGDAVSGAKLTVYEAGTTTAVTTYSDKELNTANASPVVANSSGAFGAIYVPGGLYKIDVTDSGGTSLPGYPEDNVAIVNPANTLEIGPRADVATTRIAASVASLRTSGYTSSGDRGGARYDRVGAEPSHEFKVQSADGAWWEGVPEQTGVLAEQMGAVGDDSTDDTTAISNLVSYAVSEGAAVRLTKGKTYKITSTLTVSDVQAFALSAEGFSSVASGTPNTAELKFYGTASTTLLHLDGVLYASIRGIRFVYGDAAPDAYIKVTNSASNVSVGTELDQVAFIGNGKADGSVGLDLGPGETTNDSNINNGRVECRTIQTGVRFNHSQVAAINFAYLRGTGCGTLVDVTDGGNFKVGMLDCTNNDTDVKVRGGGGNLGTFQIDSAHVEQSSASASAVFLDVASTGALGITGVLNNPIVQNNYTGTAIKVGQAAKVVCNGGHINSDIDLSGTEDEGDAVFVGIFTRMSGSITTNNWGYYRLIGPTDPTSTNPFGGSTSRAAGAEVMGYDQNEMPIAPKHYFTMPIHRPGGVTVKRTLPANALVTGVDVIIEGVGSATTEKGELRLGGTAVGTIAGYTTGPRHFGWRTNDLDTGNGDVDTLGLGDTSVLTALDSTPEITMVQTVGDTADWKSITGQIIVEYVLESVRAKGLDP